MTITIDELNSQEAFCVFKLYVSQASQPIVKVLPLGIWYQKNQSACSKLVCKLFVGSDTVEWDFNVSNQNFNTNQQYFGFPTSGGITQNGFPSTPANGQVNAQGYVPTTEMQITGDPLKWTLIIIHNVSNTSQSLTIHHVSAGTTRNDITYTVYLIQDEYYVVWIRQSAIKVGITAGNANALYYYVVYVDDSQVSKWTATFQIQEFDSGGSLIDQGQLSVNLVWIYTTFSSPSSAYYSSSTKEVSP